MVWRQCRSASLSCRRPSERAREAGAHTIGGVGDLRSVKRAADADAANADLSEIRQTEARCSMPIDPRKRTRTLTGPPACSVIVRIEDRSHAPGAYRQCAPTSANA